LSKAIHDINIFEKIVWNERWALKGEHCLVAKHAVLKRPMENYLSMIVKHYGLNLHFTNRHEECLVD
jgi:hypothetical protein